MGMPYRARVNERTLLNLPGFHGGGVRVRLRRGHVGARPHERAVLRRRLLVLSVELRAPHVARDRGLRANVGLSFDVDTPEGRENSLHKLDTLEIAIRVFRDALVAEFEPYDRREQMLESLRE